MSQPKFPNVEQLAEEYTSSAWFELEYSTFGTTAKECQKAFLAGYKACEEKQVLTKEMILEVLNKYDQEMEGYSYYGSNPGVSRDDYSDVANELLQKIRMRDEK